MLVFILDVIYAILKVLTSADVKASLTAVSDCKSSPKSG